MTKQVCLRVVSTASVLTLALVLVGLDPFLNLVPSAGAGVSNMTPAVSVNRTLKGDRLPMSKAAIMHYSPDWKYEFGSQNQSGPRAQIPVGCDPAFSPISSPMLATYYRRCIA